MTQYYKDVIFRLESISGGMVMSGQGTLLRILVLFLFLVLVGGFVDSVKSEDSERIAKMLSLTAEQTQGIANGSLEWPEYFFPISLWSQQDIERLPEDLLDSITKKERQWPVYINKHRKLFQNEFGKDVKNNYDLFIKETLTIKSSDRSPENTYIIDNKRLPRLVDLITVKGESLSKILGTSLENIRVFSYRQGKLRTIPFDIIESTDDNRIVLPEGPEGNPNDGDKLLSKNDKVFFMAVDTGAKVVSSYFSSELQNVKEVVEVNLSYPEENEVGWIYIVSFEKMPPVLSSFDYVVWNKNEAIVYTPYFFMQFKLNKIKKTYEPSFISLTHVGSPSIGALPLDINKKLKLNAYTKYVIGSISESDEDFDTSLRAFYDGNVIMYARATWKMKSPFGIGSPVVFQDLVFDPFSVKAINSFFTPFDPSLLVKYNEILAGLLYNERLMGDSLKGKGRLITSTDKEGFIIDGEMSENERAWGQSDSRVDWQATLFSFGSQVMTTVYNDYLTKVGKHGLNWSDNKAEGCFYQDYINFDKFDNRQEYLYKKWTGVPHFSSKELNWDNLNLVLKSTEKPLHIKVGDEDEFISNPFFHVPDIKSVKKYYRY